MLVLSLIANAAMLVAIGFRPAVVPLEWQHVFGGRSTARPIDTAMAERRAAVQAQSAAARATEAARSKLWSALESGDLHALIAHLRAAGFPPLVIRAIITAQVDARFAPRHNELYGANEARPYWKPDPFAFGPVFDYKKIEDATLFYHERSRLLRELLGDDLGTYFADPTAEQRQRFGSMSAAKIARVQQINDDYEEMESQLRSATLGIALPADREKFALLEHEKNADLATVMSPQEFEDQKMRSSYVTQRLRGTMSLMDATEDEFHTIFRLLQAHEDRLRAMRASEAVAMGAYLGDVASPIVLQLAQDIKAALGDQRYADYARASNNEFQQLTRLTQRENIPAEIAVRVFTLRDAVAQESNRIFNDSALALDQKRAALQSLAQQTRAQILSTLGPAAGPAYVQMARWLTLVERGNAVTFGPENIMSSKRLAEPSAAGSPPKS